MGWWVGMVCERVSGVPWVADMYLLLLCSETGEAFEAPGAGDWCEAGQQ